MREKVCQLREEAKKWSNQKTQKMNGGQKTPEILREQTFSLKMHCDADFKRFCLKAAIQKTPEHF